MGFDSADMVQRPTVHKDWAEQQAEAEAEWLHQLWAATLLQASVELEAVRKLQFVIETLTTVPADWLGLDGFVPLAEHVLQTSLQPATGYVHCLPVQLSSRMDW